VISVTLNGEKRKLKMEGGSSEQVDCLSNADAYVPSADLSTDVAAVLQHCQVVIIIFIMCDEIILKPCSQIEHVSRAENGADRAQKLGEQEQA